MVHGLQLCALRAGPALPVAPDLRDWPPHDHLAWFILDVVDQLDLDPFYLRVPKTLSMAWACSFAPVVWVRDDRQS